MSLTKACMCKYRRLLYFAHMGTDGLMDLFLWHLFLFLQIAFHFPILPLCPVVFKQWQVLFTVPGPFPLQVQGLFSCLWMTGRAVESSPPTGDPSVNALTIRVCSFVSEAPWLWSVNITSPRASRKSTLGPILQVKTVQCCALRERNPAHALTSVPVEDWWGWALYKGGWWWNCICGTLINRLRKLFYGEWQWVTEWCKFANK